ncbi:hypothetical protein GCM10009552_16160 [Rothia nasimurium]|uniref:Uncharacterized protein n=1 Tax=Luteibacter anthropi TaxID=564369 RepID=A0A7X5UB59_9GAMM|nr:hypothetical protein [Luteibacter anthropi]NII07275.1 hypothetical protein [Luteibacter anthropi]
MGTQANRKKNFALVTRELEIAGHVTIGSQVEALGKAVSIEKFERLRAGGDVSFHFARTIEHALKKPKRWMDRAPADDVVGAAVDKEQGS